MQKNNERRKTTSSKSLFNYLDHQMKDASKALSVREEIVTKRQTASSSSRIRCVGGGSLVTAKRISNNPQLMDHDEKSWLLKFSRKLSSFKDLEKGWDSYSADPPTSWSRHWAKEIIRSCSNMNFQPSSIIPSAEGGVAIAFISSEKYADIEILNTGEILAVISLPKKPSQVWHVATSQSEIQNSLDHIRSFMSA